MVIMQVFTPTSYYDDEDVEQFYVQLEATIANVPKKDFMIIKQDWNAKASLDTYDNWKVGRVGIGNTNDKGLRLLEFARCHRLTLANTIHSQKRSRIIT